VTIGRSERCGARLADDPALERHRGPAATGCSHCGTPRASTVRSTREAERPATVEPDRTRGATKSHAVQKAIYSQVGRPQARSAASS